MTIILTSDELEGVSGYRSPKRQLEELHRQGFYRARISATGNVILERAHYDVTEDAAYAMGAKGAPESDSERVLFEAWMRGHCWALSAAWDGTGYKSAAEKNGYLDPHAMATRRLWAAWRDRAALTPTEPPKDAQ